MSEASGHSAMQDNLNDEERTARDAIIAEIHAAFGGVTRGERGVSWNECAARDNYEKAENILKAACQSDNDTQWTELIDSTDWDPFPGIGGFSFINGEGFRYYLPPTMIRLLSGEDSEWFPGHLLQNIARLVDPQESRLWSEQQLRVIAAFIAFMARHDLQLDDSDEETNPWDEAIQNYWHMHLP